MAHPAFLGLDFGTSGSRACVIAGNGEVEEFAGRDFGRLEDFELAAAWRTVLFDLLAELPAGLRKRLAGIAVDGTSATVLACDADLDVTEIPLLYNDARARTEAAVVATVAGEGHPAATATSGLAKILWLRNHRPSPRARLFLNQADWLAGLLSGTAGVSDYHNALKMGFEPARAAWPEWMAGLLDADRLPEVRPPGSAIETFARAREFGVAADCLVRAGTTDSIAAFLAAGVREPGEAVTSLGTTLALKLVSERRVDDARFGVYSHWYGRYWLAGGASNAGGGVLRQFFSDDELADLSARIDPASESGLAYYPLPCPGERFPINDPDLPPRLEPRPSEPGRFLHGLLEGLADIEARGYARLAELGASPLRHVLSCGGGARNPVYARLRERRLGVPVELAPQQEAAYGSALLASRGSALFPGVCDE
jgi:sugar (pentulose or hexulose) kinase